jgi:hypothetical protein
MNWDRIRAEQASEAEARAAERAQHEVFVERALARTKRRWILAIAALSLVVAGWLVRQVGIVRQERLERTQVAVSTRPAGADVLYREEGAASFRRANRSTPAVVAVQNGKWVFRFEREWCHPEERSLDLDGGMTRVEIDFHEFGNLRLDSAPKGARIRYRKQGGEEFVELPETTPTRIVELDAGTYEIEASLKGHRAVSGTSPLATVAVGRTNAWIVRFTKMTDRADAKPTDAESAPDSMGSLGAVGSTGSLGPPGSRDATESAPLAVPPDASSLLARTLDRDEPSEIEFLRLESVPANDEVRRPASGSPPSPSPTSGARPTHLAPRDGYVRISLKPYADASSGISYGGALLLDGALVPGDPTDVVIPIGLGRNVSLAAENDRIFGRRVWSNLSVALGDTTNLGTFAFETEELIVGTRPIVSSEVTIDGRADSRRTRTPYRQHVATGTHTVKLEPPSRMRVLAAEIEYLDTGDVVTFPGGRGADTVTFELEKGRPCRVIFVVN